MGKFINTTMKTTVDSLVNGVKNRLNSPFYKFSDKHPTVCTFYNVNDTMSTLDEGNKQISEVKGQDAPLRYNKINNVFLYGLEKVQTELDVSDYGLESNEISGECILPPNTFKPYTDSYFTINHIKGNYWFRITKITTDTLENGSNFWKMEYILDDTSTDIKDRIVKEYNFIADNIGSNYKSIIESSVYEFIHYLESVVDNLIEYYNDIFFKDTLQSYVYRYEDDYFYDPEVIEFMIRTSVMNNKKYTYINQACSLPDTFSIQYDKSFYKAVEDKKSILKFKRYYGILNEDPMSLLSTRLEEYYIVTPNPHLKLLAEPIDTFPEEFIDALINDTLFEEEDKKYFNIIINYMHSRECINNDIIKSIDQIDYEDNYVIFHIVPIIIFIINKEIERLIIQEERDKKFL